MHDNDRWLLCRQAKFQEICSAQQDAGRHKTKTLNRMWWDCTSWQWLNAWPPEMYEFGIAASMPFCKLRPYPLEPRSHSIRRFSCCLRGNAGDCVGINKEGDSCFECSGRRQTTNTARVKCNATTSLHFSGRCDGLHENEYQIPQNRTRADKNE